jgi:toxin secretion/phage lysis holin
MIVLDYITGVLKAFVTKKVSSKIGALGIVKKFGYLTIASISVILDNISGANGSLRNIVLYSFIINDMISVIENCGQMGIKFPSILLSSIEKLNNDKID